MIWVWALMRTRWPCLRSPMMTEALAAVMVVALGVALEAALAVATAAVAALLRLAAYWLVWYCWQPAGSASAQPVNPRR